MSNELMKNSKNNLIEEKIIFFQNVIQKTILNNQKNKLQSNTKKNVKKNNSTAKVESKFICKLNSFIFYFIETQASR